MKQVSMFLKKISENNSILLHIIDIIEYEIVYGTGDVGQYSQIIYNNNIKNHPCYRDFYPSGRLHIVSFSERIGNKVITYFDTDGMKIQEISYHYCKEFTPSNIFFNEDGSVRSLRWIRLNENDVMDWMKKRNIIFTYENHEIPDEYKAEFKLRFV